MIALALDLSVTNVGWAWHPNRHGVETGPGKLRGVERLDAWDTWLDMKVGAVDPDVAVIEGYSFGSSAKGTRSIAEWGGVARLNLYVRGVPVVEVPPSTLKKYATGRGNAPKPDMRMELYKRTGLDVADDNEVDALWLLAAAHDATGDPLWEMPKVNREALGKVEWP